MAIIVMKYGKTFLCDGKCTPYLYTGIPIVLVRKLDLTDGDTNTYCAIQPWGVVSCDWRLATNAQVKLEHER